MTTPGSAARISILALHSAGLASSSQRQPVHRNIRKSGGGLVGAGYCVLFGATLSKVGDKLESRFGYLGGG
jgi:hypothetical protein